MSPSKLLLLASSTIWVASACVSAQSPAEVLGAERQRFSPAPSIPDGALSRENQTQLTKLTNSLVDQDIGAHLDAIRALARSDDPRVAWVLSDILRISRDPRLRVEVVHAAETLLNIKSEGRSQWVSIADHLIAWDLPAFEGYLDVKREIYTTVVPEWERLMADAGEVDWRHVSWGGVGIDDRPYDETDRSVNSIPGVDNPRVTQAAEGSWLEDDAPVFGVEINGETRAYPRFIMEIREMANDTLGGRDFALPYCTLCGSAHVWFTDRVADGIERPVLRTSGLLIRSNKLMYDVVSGSVFDTFLGHATNGPLHRKGVSLPGHPVISTTWGEWKSKHPNTTVLSREEALGRRSDLRVTRDAAGPIFPVGDVDPRLAVHDEVLGVITADQSAIAFHAGQAKERLKVDQIVELDGVMLQLEGGGLVARDRSGNLLPTHESFWFGWSQFRPETKLWTTDLES